MSDLSAIRNFGNKYKDYATEYLYRSLVSKIEIRLLFNVDISSSTVTIRDKRYPKSSSMMTLCFSIGYNQVLDNTYIKLIGWFNSYEPEVHRGSTEFEYIIYQGNTDIFAINNSPNIKDNIDTLISNTVISNIIPDIIDLFNA